MDSPGDRSASLESDVIVNNTPLKIELVEPVCLRDVDDEAELCRLAREEFLDLSDEPTINDVQLQSYDDEQDGQKAAPSVQVEHQAAMEPLNQEGHLVEKMEEIVAAVKETLNEDNHSLIVSRDASTGLLIDLDDEKPVGSAAEHLKSYVSNEVLLSHGSIIDMDETELANSSICRLEDEEVFSQLQNQDLTTTLLISSNDDSEDSREQFRVDTSADGAMDTAVQDVSKEKLLEMHISEEESKDNESLLTQLNLESSINTTQVPIGNTDLLPPSTACDEQPITEALSIVPEAIEQNSVSSNQSEECLIEDLRDQQSVSQLNDLNSDSIIMENMAEIVASLADCYVEPDHEEVVGEAENEQASGAEDCKKKEVSERTSEGVENAGKQVDSTLQNREDEEHADTDIKQEPAEYSEDQSNTESYTSIDPESMEPTPGSDEHSSVEIVEPDMAETPETTVVEDNDNSEDEPETIIAENLAVTQEAAINNDSTDGQVTMQEFPDHEEAWVQVEEEVPVAEANNNIEQQEDHEEAGFQVEEEISVAETYNNVEQQEDHDGYDNAEDNADSEAQVTEELEQRDNSETENTENTSVSTQVCPSTTISSKNLEQDEIVEDEDLLEEDTEPKQGNLHLTAIQADGAVLEEESGDICYAVTPPLKVSADEEECLQPQLLEPEEVDSDMPPLSAACEIRIGSVNALPSIPEENDEGSIKRNVIEVKCMHD